MSVPRRRTVVYCSAAWVLGLSVTTAQSQELQPRMGQPLQGLTPEQLQRFDDGKIQFTHVFQAAEGLGPTLNQNACASCHNNPVGGSGSITVTRFGFTDPKTGDFDPLNTLGGSLLQAEAIQPGCGESIPPEANTTATRATPSTLGFGLVEAIADSDIEFNSDNPPPGISGRFRTVTPLEGGPQKIGRFGWKGGVATVMTFSGDASLNEMGITNDLVPTENAPNGDQAVLALCDQVSDPEDDAPVGQRFIDQITDFQRFLAPPPQTPKSGMTGEVIFESIGCTQCHISSYTTPNDPGLELALRDKVIHPYSDFLLHDMGLLFDGIVDGVIDDPSFPEECTNCALAGEIRTPPLWGLRIRDPMLHDSSVAGDTFANRVTQAILEHGQLGSEAKPSVDDFAALLPAEKNALIAFLDSLGRAEFDHDGNNQINGDDFVVFEQCFNGPQNYTPDDDCAISDLDQDGDVDCSDYDGFRMAWTAGGQPPHLVACLGVEAEPVPTLGTGGMLVLLSLLAIGVARTRRVA